MRMYERMKNELQTYENNIGFLSISSKGGGGLLKEMERKIEKLKRGYGFNGQEDRCHRRESGITIS